MDICPESTKFVHHANGWNIATKENVPLSYVSTGTFTAAKAELEHNSFFSVDAFCVIAN
jgi:hypothetical protein